MTDETIPADKVRELADKYDNDGSGDPERILTDLIRDLHNLSAPAQPTTGLLGRWAKHPEYGDVMCAWDKPGSMGVIPVRWMAENEIDGLCGTTVPLDSLTFPHQATRPADVPAGEAWLVRHVQGMEFNAVKTSSGYYATDRSGYTWLFCDHDGNGHWLKDKEVTLVCPLVPERPVSDLQAKSTERALDRVKAKYDELESKYREAQERIKTLEQPQHPRTVTTPEEYDALPVGSHVRAYPNSCIWKRCADGMWRTSEGATGDSLHDFHPRAVLRYGWGDEQPAWRIEHDHTNLRVGEYIIDADGDTGTINRAVRGNAVWCVGMASTSRECGPWIAFVNKEAATPEAIAEAKRARDKEMEE